jgi:hypothetical protein
MLTRVLAVATALLAAFVIHQHNQIGQLQAQVVDAQTQAVQRARNIVSESLEGQTTEIQRVMKWLNGFYQAPEGLQRREGLWIDGHPDYEGLSTWVFEVYLRNRLRGLTEEQARASVEKMIRQSDEWRTKHRTQG